MTLRWELIALALLICIPLNVRDTTLMQASLGSSSVFTDPPQVQQHCEQAPAAVFTVLPTRGCSQSRPAHILVRPANTPALALSKQDLLVDGEEGSEQQSDGESGSEPESLDSPSGTSGGSFDSQAKNHGPQGRKTQGKAAAKGRKGKGTKAARGEKVVGA